ncbi:hypothetical protein TeGR_g13215 [Tetraparma gracilis]|uniref:Uncharacterized protein n=1 Tax=Tetraparma gracilis TaxID=2962635 RepID=A0ABQ6NCI3_9STRA|nr:hypothetical protein TeGR_g13215 [Tetraparma gracilis]
MLLLLPLLLLLLLPPPSLSSLDDPPLLSSLPAALTSPTFPAGALSGLLAQKASSAASSLARRGAFLAAAGGCAAVSMGVLDRASLEESVGKGVAGARESLAAFSLFPDWRDLDKMGEGDDVPRLINGAARFLDGKKLWCGGVMCGWVVAGVI